MSNFIAMAIIILAVTGAGLYIYKSRKKGIKCIGCPAAKTCNHECAGCASK